MQLQQNKTTNNKYQLMNHKTNTVIAGVDLSAVSSTVVKHATAIAQHFGTPCVLVHVMPEDFLTRYKDQAEDLYRSLHQQADAKLSSFVADQSPTATVERKICKGKPVEQLNQVIREENASLLVIAANDLTKKHLGTVASRCVRTAPCDVLILRDWQGDTFDRILVCVDYSPMSAKALERAASLAQSYGAHLEVIHVMFPPTEDYWGQVQSGRDENQEEYVAKVRARAQQQMKSFLTACPVSLEGISHSEEILESRFPSVAITHKAMDSSADLVVLGTHGMSGFVSNFIGSNAEKLLNDCAVSVLAVRD